MSLFTKIMLLYLMMMNLISFAFMGIDKHKAKNHQWRIQEKTLFIVAILGGGLGANLGMQVFRHKTKHWYFVVFMPLILVAQIILMVYYWRY